MQLKNCKMKMGKKSQSWSIDFVLAIFIFVSALIIFYSILNSGSNEKAELLQKDAYLVIRETSNENLPLTIVEKDTVNETKLDALVQKDYNEIRREIGVQNDFCIHFEDENGNVIPIKEGVVGVGSPNIKVGGVPCT